MTNPTPLSPTAQAVMDAFRDQFERCGPFDDGWELCIAAALRAAALYCKRDSAILLSIADELEGIND